MNAPLWVVELAELFWREAGGREPFPRTLRSAIGRSSFDLTVAEWPDLTVAGVERYLARRGRARTCDEVDRPLRGCLTAENGGGFIFLDARDDPAERTFSLAHELAHFLREYWQPRIHAVAALVPAILEVLDGRREASVYERLHALLRDAPIGGHVHLMRREKGVLLPDVDAAEREADDLALELLAPAVEVLARRPADGAECEVVLRRDFGLPAAGAAAYAAALFPPVETNPLLERLKKALAARRDSAGAREGK